MSQSQTLDHVYLALSHPVRREILARLTQGTAMVTEIAEPYAISLNAVSKHLKVLEKAGLVQRDVQGREHYFSINAQPLEEASQWLMYYQSFWTSRLDAMEQEVLAKNRSKATDQE